jgi:hypothetical protein
VVSLGVARQAHPGSIPTRVISGCRTKKIPSLCLIHSQVTITAHHPPAWTVAEWAVWIRPGSDGRPGFEDFLDRDLWFRDFLIKMLREKSSFPDRVFFNICKTINQASFRNFGWIFERGESSFFFFLQNSYAIPLSKEASTTHSTYHHTLVKDWRQWIC